MFIFVETSTKINLKFTIPFMKTHFNFAYIIVLVLLFSSCAQSLVYSPAVSILDTELKEKQVQFSGGVSLLPETRPEELNTTALGAQFKLGYCFTNKFNLQLSAWTDVTDKYEYFRGGYSIQSRINVFNKNKSSFEIIPRVGILFDATEIAGYGFAVDGIFLRTLNDKSYCYFGLGPIIGTYQFNQIQRGFEMAYPYGYGLIGHAAFGYKISPKLRLLLEVNPVYQNNKYDNSQYIMVSPSFTLGCVL